MKKRIRKVFGRRVVDVDGKEIKFEMTAEGVRIREKYARMVEVISFHRLYEAAKGQMNLGI
jgi:acetolactate synthase small subunit